MDLEQYISRYQLALQRIYRNVNTMIKEHVHTDITTDQFSILQFINQKERATSTEIAQSFGVGKSAITAAVNRLVQKEYIYRQRNKADRRIIYLSLTAEGEKIVKITEKEINTYISEKLTHFPLEDIDGFLIALEKLSSLMENDETYDKGGSQ